METWVLIIFGFLSLCFLLLKWNIVSRYKNNKAGVLLLPPGEMGFPFLGHTAEFMKDGQHFIRKHRSRYGNIFKTHILGAPTVISVDPELNRFILLNEGKGLLPGYPQSMINILGEYSMMAVHGSLHKTMRGAIFSLINSNMIKDVLILDADAVIRSLVTNWGDRVVDIQKKTQEMIIILGLRQVIGLKQGPRIDAVLAEFHKLIEATFSLPVYLPGTKYYHGYQGKRKIVGLLRESIEERKDSKDTNDDLLGTIRNSNNNGKVKFELSDDQILDLMISFINAGYEAVSTTAMMAVKYLRDNPKALHQLREEHMMIRRGKGETEPINWDDYKQMAFTQAVVYETLRLATVVSGVLRKTSQDMELKGYLIPKGWRIYVYMKETNHDPSLYPDSLSFNPWRWQEKSLETQMYFMTFGGGSRLCPGKELGVIEIALFLHHFVTKYRWEEVGDDIQMFPRVNAPKGFRIRVFDL